MMLHYIEAALSYLEVPDEISLCIYISGCKNNCPHCHYPELKLFDFGYPLKNNFKFLLDVYRPQISCVCFLGEGQNTQKDHEEFFSFTEYAKSRDLKTCLYSGRNIFPEDWMKVFDYVKLGSYIEHAGALFSPRTNQRFYLKRNEIFEDVTKKFWK